MRDISTNFCMESANQLMYNWVCAIRMGIVGSMWTSKDFLIIEANIWDPSDQGQGHSQQLRSGVRVFWSVPDCRMIRIDVITCVEDAHRKRCGIIITWVHLRSDVSHTRNSVCLFVVNVNEIMRTFLSYPRLEQNSCSFLPFELRFNAIACHAKSWPKI